MHINLCIGTLDARGHLYIRTWVHVYVCVCTYIYIYMYRHIHTRAYVGT